MAALYALYRKMKATGGRCSGYFLQQAESDIRKDLEEALQRRAPPDEAAVDILKTLEKSYDWLHWAVMLHPPSGPLEEQEEEEGEDQKVENKEVPAGPQPSHFLNVTSDALCCPQVVACYRDTPTALDKSRIHQVIVDLEWKIPNPPPEVYAAMEDPGRARMLHKLQLRLGAVVAVHYLYEYKHRLATGTVCVLG